MDATEVALAVVSLEHMLIQGKQWGFTLEPVQSDLQALIAALRTLLFQMKHKLDKQVGLNSGLVEETERQKSLSKTQASYFRAQLGEIGKQVTGLSMSQKYSITEKDSVIKEEEGRADRYKQQILMAVNSLAYGLEEAKAVGYRPAKESHNTLMDYINELKFGFTQQIRRNFELSQTLKSPSNSTKPALQPKATSENLDFTQEISEKLKQMYSRLAEIAKEASGCQKFCEFTVRVLFGFIQQLRKLKNLAALTNQKLAEFIDQQPEESLDSSRRNKLKGAVYAVMACMRMAKNKGHHKERVIVADHEILMPACEVSFKVKDWEANPMQVLSKMLEQIEVSQRDVVSVMSNYSYKSSL